MTMRELQAWADTLTRCRRVTVTTTPARPVLSAFADWSCEDDGIYDQSHRPI